MANKRCIGIEMNANIIESMNWWSQMEMAVLWQFSIAFMEMIKLEIPKKVSSCWLFGFWKRHLVNIWIWLQVCRRKVERKMVKNMQKMGYIETRNKNEYRNIIALTTIAAFAAYFQAAACFCSVLVILFLFLSPFFIFSFYVIGFVSFCFVLFWFA